MTIPEWIVTAWMWVGIGITLFGSLAFLFWAGIMAVGVFGLSLLRKLRALYGLGEISYWLDQHKKHGKIMMSDDTGKLVWVSTRKDGGDE